MSRNESLAGHAELRSKKAIEIVGASANNLKDVNVDIPVDAATMIVGPSGSGKSSLLSDTLGAEASNRMQRFLGLSQQRPDGEDVQAFLGPLPASIQFGQGSFRASQRTTVATCSGLLSALRKLFVKCSAPWSEVAGEPVGDPDAWNYASWLQNHYGGELTVWAVPARNVATDGMAVAKRLLTYGFREAVVRSESDSPSRRESGRTVVLSRFKPLNANVRHVIEVEVGRVGHHRGHDLVGILDLAFGVADSGAVVVELHDPGSAVDDLRGPRGPLLDSDLHQVHPVDPMVFSTVSPSLLSFNVPGNERSGACPECSGIGEVVSVALEALVIHPNLSLHGGAFSLWTEKNYKYVNIQHETIEGLRGLAGFDPDIPWAELPESARELILWGSSGDLVEDLDRNTGRRVSAPRSYEGFIPAVLRRLASGSPTTASRLAYLVSQAPCRGCAGSRWSPQARALRVGEFGITAILAAPFSELVSLMQHGGGFAKSVPVEGSGEVSLMAHLAHAFVGVGLGHLSGERGMLTVSDGEARRVRMASLLEARGSGLGLFLDEPGRGLHEADISRLVSSLCRLKQRHTVVLNDHRLSLARAADLVLALGPGAGEEGGQVVRRGPPADVLHHDLPKVERSALPVDDEDPFLEIRGATLHTLRGVDVRIPLGRFTTVTGVSGSGKSSFVRGVLLPALSSELGQRVDLDDFSLRSQGTWQSIAGTGTIEAVLALDQRSPDPNRRSIVASFIGVADTVRRAFGARPEARGLGFAATDFGLNAGLGRCQTCFGLGEQEDRGAWIPCQRCGGSRFREEILSVRLEDLSVREMLDLPVGDLAARQLPLGDAFTSQLDLLVDLDLGYITLGRRVDRLSGGEVQRLRIARRLARRDAARLLLVLDEPSAGLHPQDVARLMRVLDRIVSSGDNTLVLVEHNLDIVASSDWIVDFGPHGGPAGGMVVGQGPPSSIQALDTPTGEALRLSTSGSRRGRRATRSRDFVGRDLPSAADVPSARAARAWLRVLLGHDVAVPPDAAEGDLRGLAVEATEGRLTHCRPHEIGGLDLELARYALDSGPAVVGAAAKLALTWVETPDARLAVRPLLAEVQVWGPRIPASALREAAERVHALGLSPVPRGPGLADLASGPRFEPEHITLEACQRVITQAIATGGGHVELVDETGRQLAAAGPRWLDLDSSAVAPLRLQSAGLTRGESHGWCLACTGRGTRCGLNVDLIVGAPSAAIRSGAFLDPRALAILKGTRRLVMGPFLRRMAEEGLWDDRASFAELGAWDRKVLFHGYWHRPGPGSFLKAKSADPTDISSWLRWDGLFHAVIDQLDRSDDRAWATAVRQSVRAETCMACEGSGLAPQSRAVRLAGRSLQEWTLQGTVGELSAALAQTPAGTQRQRRTLERIVDCLEPLATDHAGLRLSEDLDDSLASILFERAVSRFTSLQTVG